MQDILCTTGRKMHHTEFASICLTKQPDLQEAISSEILLLHPSKQMMKDIELTINDP